jgi:hypothetical protein
MPDDGHALGSNQARASRDGSTPVKLPSPEETIERATLFEKNLLEDPVAGREELRRMFAGGKVLCRPQPDGIYLAEGTFLPLEIFSMRLAAETPKALAPAGSEGLRGGKRGPEAPCSIVGCAGRI